MSLTLWELKKLIARRSAKIAICFALAVSLASVLLTGIYSLGSISDTGGANFDGVENIVREYAWADEWKGELTGEKQAAAKRQLDMAYLPENKVVAQDGNVYASDAVYYKYIAPLGDIPSIWRNTFAILPEYQSANVAKQISVAEVEAYYAQREKILNDFLITQLPDEADREIFIKQNEKVITPFYYDWFKGQWLFLDIFSDCALFTAMALCIAIAPVFAGEYQQKTDSVLLCAKYERKKLAHAKINAALMLTAGTYILCSGIYIAGQLAFVGTRALNCPVQLIKPLATVSMTIWQAEAYAVLLGLLGCLAIVALTVALSARLTAAFSVIIISLLVLILPFGFSGSLPDMLQSIVALMPFASNFSELMRTNLYHIFGMRIWSPYVLVVVPIIITAALLPIAVRFYTRHEA